MMTNVNVGIFILKAAFKKTCIKTLAKNFQD